MVTNGPLIWKLYSLLNWSYCYWPWVTFDGYFNILKFSIKLVLISTIRNWLFVTVNVCSGLFRIKIGRRRMFNRNSMKTMSTFVTYLWHFMHNDISKEYDASCMSVRAELLVLWSLSVRQFCCYVTEVLQSHKWENCMTLDLKSWGFRRTMRASDVIDMHTLLSILVETIRCAFSICALCADNSGPQYK